MTRLIYDQFSKDYLEKLLSPYGEVEPGKTVVGEVREIDVWFAPTEGEIPSLLGLLGRMSATLSLFEPYRNPATSEEICDCLGKLLEIRAESQRKANRENRRLPMSKWPRLWVLTPTASEAILGGFGAQPQEDWEAGVYFCPPTLRTVIVVIHQLPQTSETLWLRLLGRGRVQSRAIDELEALPVNHPLRSITLEVLYNLQRNLERRQERELEAEDRELMMRLAPLYQQDREQAVQEGRQEGEATLVIRLLKCRLGNLPTHLEEPIRQLSIEQLENLGEALLDFESEADLTHWLSQSEN